jgi:uncharacterized protein
MSLTTYRKNGEAVATPVWFAQVGEKLYVYTGEKSGKVKRIRNNPQITLAPCTASGQILGESINAKAQIFIPPAQQAATAENALNKKYGFQKRAIMVLNAVMALFSRRRSAPAYLEITQA